MEKNLIYYSIGNNPKYAEMLKLSIASIRKCNTINYNILIITNLKYYQENLIDIKDEHILFFFIEETQDNNQIVYNRLRIFEFLKNTDYENILYLDSDTIININLEEIFTKVESHKLNVVVEDYNINNHARIHFSLGDYTDEDLKFFEDNKIYTFNSGTFLFKNSPPMKKHFNNILDIIKNFKGESFTDQSFLNGYFNKLGLVSFNQIIKDKNYFFVVESNYSQLLNSPYDGIYHFIENTFIVGNKLEKMQTFFNKSFKQKEYETREYFIKDLKKLTSGKKGVEIGVFKGEFSKFILNNWDGTLYMVDVWREIQEGYEDSSNGINHPNAYKEAMNNIKGLEERGVMIRADSKKASELFDDNSLDFIYIDANHAYDYVVEDLNLWFPKLKKGGVFSGHDYLGFDWYSDKYFCPNGKDKYIYTNNEYESIYNGVFGVNPAVDEFCLAKNYQLNKTKEWWGTWWFIK